MTYAINAKTPAVHAPSISRLLNKSFAKAHSGKTKIKGWYNFYAGYTVNAVSPNGNVIVEWDTAGKYTTEEADVYLDSMFTALYQAGYKVTFLTAWNGRRILIENNNH